jgi:hypothetical protein
VAFILKAGGALYRAKGHPGAAVLDDLAPRHGPIPGWFVPHIDARGPVFDNPTDYAYPNPRLANSRTCEWMHLRLAPSSWRENRSMML